MWLSGGQLGLRVAVNAVFGLVSVRIFFGKTSGTYYFWSDDPALHTSIIEVSSAGFRLLSLGPDSFCALSPLFLSRPRLMTRFAV